MIPFFFTGGSIDLPIIDKGLMIYMMDDASSIYFEDVLLAVFQSLRGF